MSWRLRKLIKTDQKRFDGLDMPSGPDGLYLALLKSDYAPGHQTRTWPYEKNVPKDDDEVEIVKDEESDSEDVAAESNERIIHNGTLVNSKVPRAKLLQFHENKRPAFWGTWTKKSQFVSGRYGL